MVLRRYRAQLNMMRIHNEQSHNMRTFEVPGVGGIMIAPQTREHEMFFENGKEVFLYRSPGECVEMIRHVLSMPVNDALAIRNKAREVSLEKGYHYRNRAMTALDSIRQM
jgi:spore maturation protein CgeB